MTDYNHLALLWAVEHGVIEYYVKENIMLFYTSWPLEHKTYKVTVNLDTRKESRITLRNYYEPYISKVGGRYEVNSIA